MFAITLKQPWATLLVTGQKRIETRSWKWNQPLPVRLAIHSSKKIDSIAKEICNHEPFRSALGLTGYQGADQLPLGCLLGYVDVKAIVPTEELIEIQQMGRIQRYPISDLEKAFGDYQRGRYGWCCCNPTPLVVPIPWRGKRGIWGIPDEVIYGQTQNQSGDSQSHQRSPTCQSR